ncbi:MAG TPA: Gfo/Idh/MocA family oxidoreductase [Gemmatimonadaceae bacterium]
MVAGATELRVGLIGFGTAGAAFHAPLIATTPGLRLAAIVTREPARRAQAGREHPGAAILDDADALLARAAALDLAVVATPNRTHVPLAMAALEAGLAVVVDKPLATSAADARALVSEARRRGRMLTVYQNRRWDGDFLTMRRLVAEGAVGEPLRLESRFERWRPTPKPGWRESGDPAEGGGLLFDLGSHLVDQALLLLGPVVRVYAELDRRRPDVRTDDDAFVALEHATGARSHLHMNVVSAQTGPRFRLLGRRGSYVKHGLDVQEEALRGGARPGPGWGEEPEERWGRLGVGDEARPVRTEPGAYPRFYDVVAESLRTGAPPPVDPADAVAALEVIEAARRSAHERVVVAMP